MKKIIFLMVILMIATSAFAEIWEFAITKTDYPDLPSGHKRSKQGDVVAYKPYPWEWGNAEKKNYIILVIDGISEEEAGRLTMPLYEYPDGKMICYDFGSGSSFCWPEYGAQIAKRRYRIDIDKLQQKFVKQVDFRALTDTTRSDYQPFDDGSKVFDCKSYDLIYDKYNSTNIFYGTAPIYRTE